MFSFFALESFQLVSSISRFLLFPIEHIRKPRNHRKFLSAHFSTIFCIKTIYLIWNTFQSILCHQDLTLKVLLKVIKENLPLKLEGSFFVIKAKIVLT